MDRSYIRKAFDFYGWMFTATFIIGSILYLLLSPLSMANAISLSVAILIYISYTLFRSIKTKNLEAELNEATNKLDDTLYSFTPHSDERKKIVNNSIYLGVIVSFTLSNLIVGFLILLIIQFTSPNWFELVGWIFVGLMVLYITYHSILIIKYLNNFKEIVHLERKKSNEVIGYLFKITQILLLQGFVIIHLLPVITQ